MSECEKVPDTFVQQACKEVIMSSKITALSVSDFKRVRLVEIQPNENGLTIIGGNNGQGKTSVLDAIAYALGGEAFRPSSVNNSESDKNAHIKIEIDGLVVERAGKNGALKVTDSQGMKGNQTLLNRIVNKFALDLGNFMKANDTEKTRMLLDMFPELRTQLEEMKTKSAGVYNDRYGINQEIRRLSAMITGMPTYDDVPAEEIGIADLNRRLTEANAERNAIAADIAVEKAAGRDADVVEERLNGVKRSIAQETANLASIEARHKTEVESIQQRITELQKQLEEQTANYPKAVKTANENIETLKGQQTAYEQDIVKMRDESSRKLDELARRQADAQKRISEIQNEIDICAGTNEKVRKNIERQRISARIEELQRQSDEKTREIQTIDAARKELLQKANLPLPELSIDGEGFLLYNGQKWDCMSGSERLKVATAISMNTKPGCGFVLVDGLEAMDGHTIAAFNEFLKERNMQCIGTIVGDNNATVVIEDGLVKEA